MMSKETKVLSVKQLSDILKACFENPMFSSISVYGEVYSIRLGKFSYIDLGDQGHKETSSPLLRCAFNCYYGNDFHLENIKVGDVIQITGSLSYYVHGSSITLWGKEITLLQSQLGKSLLEKKKILEKLDKLGYLDPKRKRKIPRFCKNVAILTAETGAAYQDIKKTLHDRFPCNTVLYPTIVQGVGASKSIVESLEKANCGDYDVILLGRGGGSKTDLSCFDDEKVAMAIAESKIPIITCIGHTIDTAIADRVSDYACITPTEGASLINPSLEDIQEEIENDKKELNRHFSMILNQKAFTLSQMEKRLDSLSPYKQVEAKKKKIENDQKNLDIFYSNILQKKKNEIERKGIQISSLYRSYLDKKRNQLMDDSLTLEKYNPEMIKKNGYSLIFKEGKKVYSALELKEGDSITITFSDGRKEAKVLKKEENENGKNSKK